MDRLRAVPPWAWVVGVLVLAGATTGAFVLNGSREAGPSADATATVRPSLPGSPSPSSSPSPTASPSAATARCPLNGVPLAAPPPASRPALIVQIENNPLARPIRNLGNADIVIEATVEGDVTRFSAIVYCEPTVGLTGPIRSARYYNVDLWQELHALTVHFGASSGALRRFAAAGMPSINGISGAWPYFRRYGSAPAPHNLYGDIEAVRADAADAAVAALVRRAGTLRLPFQVDPDARIPTGPAVATVRITTTSSWRFAWTWDAALGAWRRSDGGTATMDAATGAQVSATSVVVQRITESVVSGDPDPGGNPRRDLHLVGSGVGTLYVAGSAIPVRWSRPKASDLTTWTYLDGSPMILPPGKIWWELVPAIGTVTNS